MKTNRTLAWDLRPFWFRGISLCAVSEQSGNGQFYSEPCLTKIQLKEFYLAFKTRNPRRKCTSRRVKFKNTKATHFPFPISKMRHYAFSFVFCCAFLSATTAAGTIKKTRAISPCKAAIYSYSVKQEIEYSGKCNMLHSSDHCKKGISWPDKDQSCPQGIEILVCVFYCLFPRLMHFSHAEQVLDGAPMVDTMCCSHVECGYKKKGQCMDKYKQTYCEGSWKSAIFSVLVNIHEKTNVCIRASDDCPGSPTNFMCCMPKAGAGDPREKDEKGIDTDIEGYERTRGGDEAVVPTTEDVALEDLIDGAESDTLVNDESLKAAAYGGFEDSIPDSEQVPDYVDREMGV